VLFFKAEAKTQQQKMIRRLLDAYTQAHASEKEKENP
jgi:hypothetical protein